MVGLFGMENVLYNDSLEAVTDCWLVGNGDMDQFSGPTKPQNVLPHMYSNPSFPAENKGDKP